MMNYIKVGLIAAVLIWGLLWIGSADGYAETETTADVTEKSAGATHECTRNSGQCGADPRTDIWSDGGTDDDVVYWDHHNNKGFEIYNDISTFLTEEQMLAGFTMDSAIGVRDRNSVGGDPFSVQIKVTDGTTTYSDTQEFTMASGSAYETVTSQLIVPENTLAYSLATFGLIMIGDSLSGGYNGPQTNAINLTATYELPSFDVVNDVVAYVTDVIDTTVTDILESATMNTATMEIDVTTSTGTTSIDVDVSVDAGTVTMSVPTISGGIQSMTIDTGMSSSDSGGTVEAVAEVASAVAEVETAIESEQKSESKSESKSDSKESKSESKQETKESKADKAKVVQAIVSRILQSIEVSGGDVNDTKIALMGISGAGADFASYQTASIPDVAFYDTTVSYESPQMPDPLGGIYNLGSNQMMDEMTDSQYNFGE
jgi:hypothetical protein